MNVGVIKLFKDTISSSPKLYARRLQIEDNIGEAIHIHYRNFRLDLTVRDFLGIEKCCYDALLKILERSNSEGHVIDRSFLIAITRYVSDIISIDKKTVRLSDLRAIKYDNQGWSSGPISESAAYRYLQGDTAYYVDYLERHGKPHQSIENIETLRKDIAKNGYDADLGAIVTFGDEPYIRDGQHRAAIIYYLKGDIEVPIFNVQFSVNSLKWRMHKNNPSLFSKASSKFKRIAKFGVNLLRRILA